MSHLHEKLRALFSIYHVVEESHGCILLRVTIADLVHAPLKPWKYSRAVDMLLARDYADRIHASSSANAAALQQEPFDTVHAAFFEDAPDALQVYKDENTWMALRMVFLENPVAKHEVMVEVRDGVTVRELLEEREQGRRCDRWC